MTKQQFPKILVASIAVVLFGYLIVTLMSRFGRVHTQGTNTSGQNHVFPEDLLLSWGYKTSSIDELGHEIRSLRNYGSSEEAFYARFDLAVASFASPAEAASEIEKLESERNSLQRRDEGYMREKDYRQFLQRGAMIYTVTPTSNYTRLDHLPLLLSRIKEHFAAQKP